LATDATLVKVDSNRIDRGDDQIDVTVVSPDGTEESIYDFGGTVKVFRR
jgi:hypothetical protein